jgi:hypothetical protein
MELRQPLGDKVQDGNGINDGHVRSSVFMPEALGRSKDQGLFL